MPSSTPILLCLSFFIQHLLILSFALYSRARGTDPSLLKVWETGTFYHFVHALGLLLLATRNKPSNGTTLAAGSFALGTTLFSGSLYLLTLTEQKAFGAITPIGGSFFFFPPRCACCSLDPSPSDLSFDSLNRILLVLGTLFIVGWLLAAFAN